MAKLSDADRLARLLEIISYLGMAGQATVGELADRFGGSPRSVYEDLLAAWTAEDPVHVGIFPFGLQVEYFTPDDPDRRPISVRQCWLSPGPSDRALRDLTERSWKSRRGSPGEVGEHLGPVRRAS